jgi:carbamoyl-phosphate synthase large subunit
MEEVNILIGSGGRRNYLVNWFRQAISDMGVKGAVCVIDATHAAPSLADADRFAIVPPFGSDEYFPALTSLCHEWNVGLAFSLNDFESTRWASAQQSPFSSLNVNLVAASASCQALVEDKLAYASAFNDGVLRTPITMTGIEAMEIDDLPWDGDVIVKHRYGSGSIGLARVSPNAWREQLLRTADGARDKDGAPVSLLADGLKNVVVQQAIDGVEYGLDVVHDFQGRFVASLARQKLRMRSGETDQATTVDAAPFLAAAQALGEVTGHRGLIDTDLIVDREGVPYVIDVNPRFGGGYPFSHVAGAQVPRAYVAWHLGRTEQAEWFDYAVGVTASKTEDIRIARRPQRAAGLPVS